MIPALVPLLMTRQNWQGFRVNQVEMAFQMPTKPEVKQAMFKNAPATFYTSDSGAGRFVAGYIAFPEGLRPTMQQQIKTDPGGAGVRSLIETTISEFAKGGSAKITSPEFGLDRGLPTEFATLKGPKASLKIRVYLGSLATYIFITSAKDQDAFHYFESLKLPAEITKG